MTKIGWPESRLEGLYQVIEEGTLDDIEVFIDVECKGCLPGPDVFRRVDGYGFKPGEIILGICCRAKRLDVLDTLLDRDLGVPQFSMEDLFKDPTGTNRAPKYIDYDDGELVRLKQLIYKMIDGGARLFDGDYNCVIHMFEVYPEDIDLYEKLRCAGLDFEYCSSMWGAGSYNLAFEKGYWRTAEYFAAHHVDIRCGLDTGVIEKGWPPAAIDFVLEHNIDIGLFDDDASVETVMYAIRKGMTLKPRYHDTLWEAVVNCDNVELGGALITEGVPFESVSAAHPEDPATLEWANRVGLEVTSVSATCGKEVLLKAAELRIPPIVRRFSSYNGQTEITYSSGYEYLSNHLDFDVIKAYLDAGIGDEFDPSSAIENGRTDIIELFEQYGITARLTSIKNAAPYVDDQHVTVIPEGVKRIEAGAFQINGGFNQRYRYVAVKELHLPESLETIDTGAFTARSLYVGGDGVIDGSAIVRLPKAVKTVGANAFSFVSKLEFHDSLDGSCIGLMNGIRGNCEFTVLSSDDSSVRFRVWRPDENSLPYKWSNPFAEAWRHDCSFDFAVLDSMYPDLKTPNAKLHTAINRLTWPIDLDEKTAKKYQRYISQNLDAVMDMLCVLDDPDRLEVVFSFAKLNSEQIERFKALAKSKKAKAVEKALDGAVLTQPVNDDMQEKPKAKKPTVPQLITMVADALDEGDASKLEELRPVAAKVPMVDCVELLERTAANCTGETIDALYGMFAPFECTSSALLVALFSGNESTSKALVARGADLDGRITYVSERRTPKAKREGRVKRYSRGLVGKRYSAGGEVARNLREALTKDDGSLLSRTKVREKYGSKYKVVVNETSNEKAANTLIAISKEEGFKKSIAVRLLWNFISFDGRKTTDACFDAKSARIVLKAGILDDEDLNQLPWAKAIDSFMSTGYRGDYIKVFKLVRDYAPQSTFESCWRSSFAKPNTHTGKYDDIKTLLLFIDVLDAGNCSNQLDVLRALTETGEFDALKKLSEKPGWFTKQRIKKLVEVASAAGKVEIAAWLLDLSEKDHKLASPSSLEL